MNALAAAARPAKEDVVLGLLAGRLRQSGVADLIRSSEEDAATIAERMAAALPGAHPADRRLGPFYTTGGLVTWLGVSRQRLHVQARRGDILALRTADGELLYPAFQFGADRSLLPHLRDVLALLRAGTDSGWQHALWLNTPIEDGETPARMLRAGRIDEVRTEAARDAEAWAA